MKAGIAWKILIMMIHPWLTLSFGSIAITYIDGPLRQTRVLFQASSVDRTNMFVIFHFFFSFTFYVRRFFFFLSFINSYLDEILKQKRDSLILMRFPLMSIQDFVPWIEIDRVWSEVHGCFSTVKFPPPLVGIGDC